MSETQGEAQVPGASGSDSAAATPPADPAAAVDAIEQRVFGEKGNPLDSPDAEPAPAPAAEPPV